MSWLSNVFAPRRAAEKAPESELSRNVRRLQQQIAIDVGGGCSFEKGLLLATLISELRLPVSVDIGVYRGRSLVPQATAHQHEGTGKVYGIDPWQSFEAVQNDNPALAQALDKFVNETNFEGIYRDVTGFLSRNGLTQYTTILRQTSAAAASYFVEHDITIDLLHIDGNHDTNRVMLDCEKYVPLMSDRCVIVLDDSSWDSVRPAIDTLRQSMTYIAVIDKTDCDDFAVFARLPADEIDEIRSLLRELFAPSDMKFIEN